MVYLKYQDIELPVLDDCSITKSSQEVTFSDLKCEFTGHSADQLPEKYQEVQIISRNTISEELLYTGYVDSYKFDKMREQDIEMFIDVTLLSPMKMATLRTVIANGTYKLISLIENIVLNPLIEDGYTLKEINISDHEVTVNFLCETIEYCMNNLSNKFNFWWFIDEHKNIYIKDVDVMLATDTDLIYDDENRIAGLEYIQPVIESDDYANVINFKNVRIYEYSTAKFDGQTMTSSHNPLISTQVTKVKSDDTIELNYPIDINVTNILKSAESNGKLKIGTIVHNGESITGNYATALNINGTYANGNSFSVYYYVLDDGTTYISNNLDITGNNEDKEFTVVKDSFYSNLITGIKFKNDSTTIATIEQIESDSVLVYNINKLYNDKAILSKKNKISNTGIVELTVDMNQSWKTIQELAKIGSSYMNKNSIEFDGTINLKLDQNVINVGDILRINKMLFNSKYIVTQVEMQYNNNDFEYTVTAKNTNILSSFIDVFRGENSQTSEEQEYKVSVTHYDEEGIIEEYEVIQ